MPAAGPWTGYPPELLLGTESGYATAAPYQPLPQPQGMTNDPRAWCRAIYRGDTLSMGLMPDACIELGYPEKIAQETLPGFGRMPGTTAAEREQMAEDLGIKGFVGSIPPTSHQKEQPMYRDPNYQPPWPLTSYPYPNNTLGPMQATDVGRRSGTQVGCYTKVGRIEIGAIDIGGVEIMGGYIQPSFQNSGVDVGAVEIMGGYIQPSFQNSGVDVGGHVEGGYVHTAPLGVGSVDIGRHYDARPPKKRGFWETLFGKRQGTSVGQLKGGFSDETRASLPPARSRPNAAYELRRQYGQPSALRATEMPNELRGNEPLRRAIDRLPQGQALVIWRQGARPKAYWKDGPDYRAANTSGFSHPLADLVD